MDTKGQQIANIFGWIQSQVFLYWSSMVIYNLDKFAGETVVSSSNHQFETDRCEFIQIAVLCYFDSLLFDSQSLSIRPDRTHILSELF